MEIKDNLARFGLNPKEVEVYLTLTESDWLTALQISRKCPIKRTTLYRILESLAEKGLIEAKIEDKTTLYSTATAEHFENLIREKENQIKQMRQILPEIETHISLLREVRPGEVSVRFYRGIRGLQYLELKTTRPGAGEILIIDSNQWDKVLSREFAEEVRARIVQNDLQVREISNITDLDTSWTDNEEYVKSYYRSRTIEKKILNISQDIHIFGDMVQFSGYSQRELVGIEIVSREYAEMLRQMFEVLWKMAGKK